MKLFRCTNLECADRSGAYPKGFVFMADTGTCPKCGASLHDPESKHLISKRVLLHFHPLTKWGKGRRISGEGMLACTGQPFAGAQATGDPSVVTCPACKLTDAWKQAASDWGYEVIDNISDERKAELQAASRVRLNKFKGQHDRGARSGADG